MRASRLHHEKAAQPLPKPLYSNRMQNLPSPTAEAQLLEWLLAQLAPMNRTRVKQLLRSGRVHVNGTSVTRHDHPLHPGDKLTIARDAPAPDTLGGIAIVYEDAHLIVIDKP